MLMRIYLFFFKAAKFELTFYTSFFFVVHKFIIGNMSKEVNEGNREVIEDGKTVETDNARLASSVIEEQVDSIVLDKTPRKYLKNKKSILDPDCKIFCQNIKHNKVLTIT